MKVAAVAALLGVLVWADARWAGTADCAAYGVHADGRPGTPAQLVDRTTCTDR